MFPAQGHGDYPEEKTPQSTRFRGLHALRRYPNGGSAASPVSCARRVLPALAITIESDGSDGDAAHHPFTTSTPMAVLAMIFCGFLRWRLCTGRCHGRTGCPRVSLDRRFDRQRSASYVTGGARVPSCPRRTRW